MVRGFSFTERGKSFIDVIDEAIGDLRAVDVDVCTAAARVGHVEQLAAWRSAGRIGRLRLVVSSGAMALYKDDRPGRIESAVGADSVRAIRAHAKWAVVGGSAFLTSANLAKNGKAEQYQAVDADAARGLRGFFDAVFGSVPPGCSASDNKTAYHGMLAAHTACSRASASRSVVWHFESDDIVLPAGDHFTVVTTGRVGALPVVLEAVDRAGGVSSSSVVASTWGIGRGDVVRLGDCVDAGLALDLCMPSRFGRRTKHSGTHAEILARLACAIRWKGTHMKVSVVRGPLGAFIVGGTSNLSQHGELNVITFAKVPVADADSMARAVLSAPDEAAPEPPAKTEPCAGPLRRARVSRRVERDDGPRQMMLPPVCLEFTPR